ncbi:MAG TPA: alpha/beta fold hydrolase [Candidatus Sulfotelmatobacter sp.]|nr:alpha/beta fold hydrolase [Candidatus Sulfotelmatobacter sp.]
MNTLDFLLKLKQSGVKVWLEDDRLRCTGPEQVLVSEVRAQLSTRKLEIIDFLRSAASSADGSSSVVPIQPLGSRRPLFAVPGHNGDVFCYVDLARHLGTDQPLFALQAPGMEPGQEPLTSIEAIASVFARDMAAVQPQGPYLLAGFCVGGSIAFELAQQLTAKNQQVSLLVLFGSPCPTALAPHYRTQAAVMNIAGRFLRHGSALAQRRPSEWSQYLRERAAERRADRERERHDPLRLRLAETTVDAFKAYQPKAAGFPVHMLMPNDQPDSLLEDRPLDWGLFARNFTMALGPEDGDMNTMLLEPHVRLLAQLLGKKLGEAVPPQVTVGAEG